jgi:hypothetical protein
VLGQHGFRVYEGALLIANKNQAIDELMQKTRFKVDRKGALLRIPGSAKVPVKHFPGGTSSRSVSIPIEHVRALMEDEPHEPGKF